MDGRLIFLHHMQRSMASGRFGEGERPDRNGRPARARAFTIPKSSESESRKTLVRLKQTVRTKTDTGRRDEDSKALERTLVKELGKLTP